MLWPRRVWRSSRPPGSCPNLNEVNVAVDCDLVLRGNAENDGTEDQWYFDDPDIPTRIIIDGSICEAIENGGVQRIDTIFGCPTQTLG